MDRIMKQEHSKRGELFISWCIVSIVLFVVQLVIVWTVSTTSFPTTTERPRYKHQHWLKDGVCQSNEHNVGESCFKFHFKNNYTLPELAVSQYESVRDWSINLYEKAF